MKKSDIKTGMVVELADGDKFIILNTEVGKVGLNNKLTTHLDLSEYDPDTLKHKNNDINDMDIITIYTPKLDNNITNFKDYKGFLPTQCWGLMDKIWERK